MRKGKARKGKARKRKALPTHHRPRFGKIPAAVAYSGRSRSRLYELAPQYRGLFRKDGFSTIVDFDILDRVCDDFPIADIKPPTPRERHHGRPRKADSAVAGRA
jgi:hypothetical protein